MLHQPIAPTITEPLQLLPYPTTTEVLRDAGSDGFRPRVMGLADWLFAALLVAVVIACPIMIACAAWHLHAGVK